MVQRTSSSAAAAINDLVDATVSADLLARAKTLNEALLALRALETRHSALRAEATSPTETTDQRMAAMASAYGLRIPELGATHDLRIRSLESSRPSGLTAYLAPVALVDARVASLEAPPRWALLLSLSRSLPFRPPHMQR